MKSEPKRGYFLVYSKEKNVWKNFDEQTKTVDKKDLSLINLS